MRAKKEAEQKFKKIRLAHDRQERQAEVEGVGSERERVRERKNWSILVQINCKVTKI